MVPKGSMLRLKIKDKVLHPSLRETKAQHTQKRKDNVPAPKERPALPQDCGLTTTRYLLPSGQGDLAKRTNKTLEMKQK